jgi:hypothetical protein
MEFAVFLQLNCADRLPDYPDIMFMNNLSWASRKTLQSSLRYRYWQRLLWE